MVVWSFDSRRFGRGGVWLGVGEAGGGHGLPLGALIGARRWPEEGVHHGGAAAMATLCSV